MGGAKKKPGTEKVLVGTRLMTCIWILTCQLFFKPFYFQVECLPVLFIMDAKEQKTTHISAFQYNKVIRLNWSALTDNHGNTLVIS